MSESQEAPSPTDTKPRLKRSYKHSSYACAKCRASHRRCKHNPEDDPEYDGSTLKRTRKRRKAATTTEEETAAAETLQAMQPPPPATNGYTASTYALTPGQLSSSTDSSVNAMGYGLPDLSMGMLGASSTLGVPQPQQIAWLVRPIAPPSAGPSPSPSQTPLPSFNHIAGLAQHSPVSRSSSVQEADFLNDLTTFDQFDLTDVLMEFFSHTDGEEEFWRGPGMRMIDENAALKHAALGAYLLHRAFTKRQAEGLLHVDKAMQLLNKQLAVKDPSVWQTGMFTAALLAIASFCACEPLSGARLHMNGVQSIFSQLWPRLDECRPELRRLFQRQQHCTRLCRSAVKEYRVFVDIFQRLFPDLDLYAEHEVGAIQELLVIMLDALSCFFDLSGAQQRKESLTLVGRLQRTLVREWLDGADAKQRVFRPLLQEALYDLLASMVYPDRDLSTLRTMLASKMFDGEAACGTFHFARLTLAALDKVIYEPAAQYYAN